MEYRGLDGPKNEIRLLTILPAPEGTEASIGTEPVQCSLDHYSLGDLLSSQQLVRDQLSHLHNVQSQEIPRKPTSAALERENDKHGGRGRFQWGDFVALSYCWGPPGVTKHIIVNDITVNVQENLEAALRMLRDGQSLASYCKLWVDALCINQKDLGERKVEVGRMRLIYRLASNVIIWLGPEADNSGNAMDLILTLSDSCKSGTDRLLGACLRQNPDSLGQGVWLALSMLLDRPYWHRTWVIQEMAMANGSAQILCGSKFVSWDDLFRAVYTFGTFNVDIMFTCITRERAAVGLPPYGLNRNKIIHINDEHAYQAKREDSQFLCMLDLVRKSDVTDPRDKVYGILGLMEESVAQAIKVDYTLPVDAVYVSFAESYIRTTGRLDLLEQCRWVENGIPSWAPDWTYYHHWRLYSGRRSRFRVGGTGKPSFEFQDQGHILKVDGIMIDTITGLGTAYFEDDVSLEPEHALVQPETSEQPSGADQALKDAIWRTLVCDSTFRGKPAPEEYAFLLNLPFREGTSEEYVSRGARAYARILSQNGSLSIAGRRLDSYFSRTTDYPQKEAMDALEQLWRFSRSRRLAISQKGRLGMVPNAAKKGDIVYVLLGCDVPLLVRPDIGADTIRIVGSCYLHGVMREYVDDGLANVQPVLIR